MMDSTTNAELKANFQAHAIQSQATLLAFVFAVMVMFILSTVLFMSDRNAPGYFLGVGGLTLAGYLVHYWHKAQPDSDSMGAQPTTITTAGGDHISTDLRVMRSQQAVENLLQLTAVTLYRKPLPEASGLLNDIGQLLNDSEDEARAIVAGINEQIQTMTNEAIDQLGIAETRANFLTPAGPPTSATD